MNNEIRSAYEMTCGHEMPCGMKYAFGALRGKADYTRKVANALPCERSIIITAL